jgi:PAS domain S-box-containing protein
MSKKSTQDLTAENQELRIRLEEAQETLEAIRRGEVDGLVVSTPKGEQVYTLTGADKPYRALIEDMREGAVMISDDNTVLYCNSGFAKIMKRPMEKIVGVKVETLVCPSSNDSLKDLLSIARARKSAVSKEITLLGKDDALVPALMSVNSLQSDTTNNTFLVVTDLSEHMEAETKRYTEGLEKLVEARTKQLKDSERLATIGATAGMVGHDIRNPLQTVAGEVFLARAELKNLPEGGVRANLEESLDIIQEQTMYVNKIVSDLQDYSKPLNPKIEEVDLEKTVQAVLSSISVPESEPAEPVQICYSITPDFPKINTDESYLRRILQNLVTNSIQAMPKGGDLTINASCKNGRVVITVQDTGDGIPLEVRDKLFMPLVTTKAKGQGFGLAVVKRFTEGMGGTVRFESEVGKGTKFLVELPAK